MSSAESDAQLVLKKRARRRLVGAVAFAVLAAVVLPMVMDQAPPSTVPDVRINIPDSKQVAAFTPPLDQQLPNSPPASTSTAAPPPPMPTAAEPVAAPVAAPVSTSAPQKATEVGVSVPAPAPAPARHPAKTPPLPASEKAALKDASKDHDKDSVARSEAERAAAILSGKSPGTPTAPGTRAAGGSEQHIILIGAFANAGNVKVLEKKLGELGIKTYTEPLDSPQGRKIRVRAGPFPTRAAAEKALAKMKRIGVSGDISARH